MIRTIEGIPVVTDMDHWWSQKSPRLREAYNAARMALDDLVRTMNEHDFEMEQAEWLEVVREMAAANVYADSCKSENCAGDGGYQVQPHWFPIAIESEGEGWLVCHYNCPKHGHHTCGYSPLAPWSF
jgi:hypothetical protein